MGAGDRLSGIGVHHAAGQFAVGQPHPARHSKRPAAEFRVGSLAPCPPPGQQRHIDVHRVAALHFDGGGLLFHRRQAGRAGDGAFSLHRPGPQQVSAGVSPVKEYSPSSSAKSSIMSPGACAVPLSSSTTLAPGTGASSRIGPRLDRSAIIRHRHVEVQRRARGKIERGAAHLAAAQLDRFHAGPPGEVRAPSR